MLVLVDSGMKQTMGDWKGNDHTYPLWQKPFSECKGVAERLYQMLDCETVGDMEMEPGYPSDCSLLQTARILGDPWGPSREQGKESLAGPCRLLYW